MKIETKKRIIDQMTRCYALAQTETTNGSLLIVASEAVGGASKMYYGENFELAETIWEDLGGTMSIVPLSNETNETASFLISQNYFPGFEAKASQIVKVSKEADHWLQEPILAMPYLHRFDLIEVEKVTYIVCSTLCSWKTEREDWTSPGHVFMGVYHHETNQVTNLQVVLPNVTKNHGMSKISEHNQESILISAEDGIYVIRVENGQYVSEKKYDIASSETLLLDINDDGVEEVIVIEPFHGDTLGIYQQDGQLLHQIKRKTQFLHALWGGKVLGKQIVICSGRHGEADLVVFYLNEAGTVEKTVIDSGNGSANIVVTQKDNELRIISANNLVNEIAEYRVVFGE